MERVITDKDHIDGGRKIQKDVKKNKTKKKGWRQSNAQKVRKMNEKRLNTYTVKDN